jgi:hypothetical protein
LTPLSVSPTGIATLDIPSGRANIPPGGALALYVISSTVGVFLRRFNPGTSAGLEAGSVCAHGELNIMCGWTSSGSSLSFSWDRRSETRMLDVAIDFTILPPPPSPSPPQRPRAPLALMSVAASTCTLGICSSDIIRGPCWLGSLRSSTTLDRSRGYWTQINPDVSANSAAVSSSCGVVRPGIAYGFYEPTSGAVTCPADKASMACCQASDTCALPAARQTPTIEQPTPVPLASGTALCRLTGKFNYYDRKIAATVDGKIAQLYSESFRDFTAMGITIVITGAASLDFTITVPSSAGRDFCSCDKLRSYSNTGGLERIDSCTVN